MSNESEGTNSNRDLPELKTPGFFRSRKFLAVFTGLVLLSFTGFLYTLYVMSAPPPAEQLESALKIFQQGDGETAARIAESMDDAQLESPALSQKHFLMGVQAREAARKTDQHSQAYAMNEESITHLQKSQSIQFPNGYEGLGNYHLGMALYDLFRWKEAKRPLEIATERWPQGRSDAMERLVDIDLSSENKDVPAAFKRIERWRTLPSTSAEDPARADIKEMQAQLSAGNYDLVHEMLSSITPDSKLLPQAQFLAGLANRKRHESAVDTADREKLLIDALELQAAVLKSSYAPLDLKRKANLERGSLLKLLGKLPDAISAFGQLRMSSPHTPEGLAAGINELETLFEAGRFDETPSTMKQISSNLGELKWYANDDFSLGDVRGRLVALGRRLIEGKHFGQADGYVKALPVLSEELDNVRLESDLYERWAQSLPAVPQSRPERIKFSRLSAQALELLLNSFGRSTEYNDWLWRAITNYQGGELYRDSNRLLERFLSLETRENRSKGYYAQAQNYKALAQLDDAIASLQNVIGNSEVPNLVYEARLELAKIKAARGEQVEAVTLLQDCLNGDLRPESATWQEALRTLAKLTFENATKLVLDGRDFIAKNPSQVLSRTSDMDLAQKSLLESIGYLEEFIRRYPAVDDLPHIQYRLATAYELAAYWPNKQLELGLATTQGKIEELESESDLVRSEAERAYSAVKLALMRSELSTPSAASMASASTAVASTLNVATPSGNPVSADETLGLDSDQLLRNSIFGLADLYYRNSEYAKAADLYAEAAVKYTNLSEGLEARTQLAFCQRKQGNSEASMRSINQALEQLAGIPESENSRFAVVTSHDRDGWKRYLESLQSQWLDEDSLTASKGAKQ